MADDGNRQIAISLDLGKEQFDALDTKLGGIEDAINGLPESNTDLIAEVSQLRIELGMRLTALNESIVEASANLGKWLSAIALAASTPDDNSAEVQAQIDKHASEIHAVRQTLQSSIDRNQPEGE